MKTETIQLKPFSLNYLDWFEIAALLSGKLKNTRIKRVFVPGCDSHPDGFYKSEWVLELASGRSDQVQLYISLRNQAVGVALIPNANKHPNRMKPTAISSRSGFDLGLSKATIGRAILAVRTYPNERMLVIELDQGFSLHFLMIPQHPDAWITEKTSSEEVVKYSFSGKPLPDFTPNPAVTKPDTKFELNPILTAGLVLYSDHVLQCRLQAANKFRFDIEDRVRQEKIKALKKKIASDQEQLRVTRAEPHWGHLADILKANLHTQPVATNGFYFLHDYQNVCEVKIAAVPSLTPSEQVSDFFKKEKRNKSKISAAKIRLTEQEAELDRLLTISDAPVFDQDASQLLASQLLDSQSHVITKKVGERPGKTFRSDEGLEIVVGRNLDENLLVTFKVARGNDLWFHVKGRPGSHVVILIPAGKSASLESILDAANLCLHYSNGREWGKTEVDYVFRKHVKKIKKSKEVQYLTQKTLIVDYDQGRVKRLFDQLVG